MSSFPSTVWNGQPVSFKECAQLQEERFYAVVTIVVWRELVLLAQIQGRGWSAPSGRVQPPESPFDAARRETYEETGGLLGELRPLGCYTIGDPADAPMLVPLFTATLKRLDPIPDGFESTAVALVAPEELPHTYYYWDPLLESVFALALGRLSPIPFSTA
jgi:8-oxo-dGTP diphosphatase